MIDRATALGLMATFSGAAIISCAVFARAARRRIIRLDRRGAPAPVPAAERVSCAIVGHDPQGEPVPCYTGLSPSRPYVEQTGSPYSGIAYRFRPCARRGRQVPVTEQDARNKAALDNEIGAVMNRSRADYGLPPLDWSL
jgi:hypothetical protein